MLTALLVLALLLVLNGALAMAELAMMTSRHSRLQQAARSGNKGAATAIELARHPTRFLSTVQVGITLIGILAGAFGENSLSGEIEPLVARVPLLEPHADTVALAIVVLAITYCSLVIGELVPKRIALAYPEAVASTISRPLQALSIAANWPVRLLTGSTELILRMLRIRPAEGDDVSEEDVRVLIARATSTGIFTSQELALFERTMRAGDLVVRDLMVARKDIIWIDEDEPIDSVRVLVGTSPHSHFPVCRGGIDKLSGVVHVKDLIAYGLIAGKEFKVTDVAQRPLFVPEAMPALKLLDIFQSSRSHVAFVVDEYGGTRGMLTLNDITRALLGDVIRRGGGTTPAIVERRDGSWLVDGRLPLHDLVVRLGLAPQAQQDLPNVSTVAGMVTTLLGRIPHEGETLAWQGFTVEVLDMDGMRIDKLLLTRPSTRASA